MRRVDWRMWMGVGVVGLVCLLWLGYGWSDLGVIGRK